MFGAKKTWDYLQPFTEQICVYYREDVYGYLCRNQVGIKIDLTYTFILNLLSRSAVISPVNSPPGWSCECWAICACLCIPGCISVWTVCIPNKWTEVAYMLFHYFCMEQQHVQLLRHRGLGAVEPLVSVALSQLTPQLLLRQTALLKQSLHLLIQSCWPSAAHWVSYRGRGNPADKILKGGRQEAQIKVCVLCLAHYWHINRSYEPI